MPDIDSFDIRAIAAALVAEGIFTAAPAAQVEPTIRFVMNVCADAVAPELTRLRTEVKRLTAHLSAQDTAVGEAQRLIEHLTNDRDAARADLALAESAMLDLRRLAASGVHAEARAVRELEAEADRMRPVVEAAVAWRSAGLLDAEDVDATLSAAVDAWTAGTQQPTDLTGFVEVGPHLIGPGFARVAWVPQTPPPDGPPPVMDVDAHPQSHVALHDPPPPGAEHPRVDRVAAEDDVDAHPLSLAVSRDTVIAVCGCGWTGSAEASRHMAMADHATHVHVAAGLAVEDGADG